MLACLKCKGAWATALGLARHLVMQHGFYGDEAVAAATRIEQEATKAAAALAPRPVQVCSECEGKGHNARTCYRGTRAATLRRQLAFHQRKVAALEAALGALSV